PGQGAVGPLPDPGRVTRRPGRAGGRRAAHPAPPRRSPRPVLRRGGRAPAPPVLALAPEAPAALRRGAETLPAPLGRRHPRRPAPGAVGHPPRPRRAAAPAVDRPQTVDARAPPALRWYVLAGVPLALLFGVGLALEVVRGRRDAPPPDQQGKAAPPVVEPAPP